MHVPLVIRVEMLRAFINLTFMKTFRKNLAIFLLMGTISLSYAQQRFSKEDSLRGTVTLERKWWDATYYHLSVAVDPEKRHLNGNVIINYKVLNPYSVMQIDLQPPLKMERAVQHGKELRFSKVGNNVYMVDLVDEQKSGAVESIQVYYSGRPMIARNPPWQGGFQFAKDSLGNDFIATSCQGLGASVWWPNKDHNYDEPDSMLMSITVPEHLTDVSNGRLRSVMQNDDSTKTFNWFVSNPISNYGVNVNIGAYTHFSDTLHGENGLLDLDFYVMPYNLRKAKSQFRQAKLMLKAFEHWFGPYPFYEDGYKLVEAPYLGMEHQSSVTYGNGYKNGYRGHDLSGTGWGLKWDFIIIHESGHEWFANNITYRDIADMWIHESFTNYSESLFTEYYFGKEAATDYVVGTRKGIKNDIPIIGIYNVNQRGSGDMYSKGGNMLHTIRHAINNDSLFRQILRGLNKTFFHKTVTSAQVENYISANAGIDLSKVFDQYLRTVKIPKLEYYQKNKTVFYRWTNCVDGFNLRLARPENKGNTIIYPTTSWKKLKVKGNSGFDETYLKRMYYIDVVRVVR